MKSMIKRLAGTGAALGLAAAGVVGLGAGAAHADGQRCAELDTRSGARISMCAYVVNANYLKMSYNVIQRGRTDERAWFQVTSQCGQYPGAEGSSYDWFSDNDYNTSYDTFEKWCDVPNGGFNVAVKVTESGNVSDYQGVVYLY
ncbi:hypothetical protein ACFV0O_41330 [Kitasatospora sp. NPDC059577]|uniref:hypothetical protein n=1 Tax=Kitasatospora sp. NPDC059577 TaxID=3346873 RepID=UPI0036A6796C